MSDHAVAQSANPMSRRDLLRWAATIGATMPAIPVLSACGGFSTSGGGKGGDLTFL